MASDPKVLVIIPAFNEEESILITVRGVQDAGYDYVIVNDGSQDSTLSLCREHHLNVLDLPVNLGIGGAVQAGHLYAKRCGYEIDVQFDGDGQHDVAYIQPLVQEVIQGADLVIGSRFVDGSSSEFKSTFMRRAGIRWLAAMVKLITGATINDPTSGFRACGSRAIDLFCDSYPLDYPEPESIIDARKNGLVVCEIPVSMNERQGGRSSIRMLSSIYYMVKVTLAMLITGLMKRSS